MTDTNTLLWYVPSIWYSWFYGVEIRACQSLNTQRHDFIIFKPNATWQAARYSHSENFIVTSHTYTITLLVTIIYIYTHTHTQFCCGYYMCVCVCVCVCGRHISTRAAYKICVSTGIYKPKLNQFQPRPVRPQSRRVTDGLTHNLPRRP
jgi:hypothetical protein